MPRLPTAQTNDLGYWFDPSDRPGGLGHSRLTVVLSEQPSRRHFDPERVELDTADEDRVERAVIVHPWIGFSHLRMVAGEIHVVDRRGKSIAAFTFGGDLDIEAEPSGTRVSITSPVPLLDRQSAGGIDVEGALAEEFMILLAERRAQAGEHLTGFEQRLARADPLTLYAASLLFLEARFGRLSSAGSETYERSLRAVRREIGSLKENGAWSSPEPSLEQVL